MLRELSGPLTTTKRAVRFLSAVCSQGGNILFPGLGIFARWAESNFSLGREQLFKWLLFDEKWHLLGNKGLLLQDKGRLFEE